MVFTEITRQRRQYIIPLAWELKFLVLIINIFLALRSMATQSMKTAAEKSQQEELFASMKAKMENPDEEESPTPKLPEIEIAQPSLVLERQIQGLKFRNANIRVSKKYQGHNFLLFLVHDDVIIEKDEPKTNVVEIKTANINFEVEEMEDLELKPDLGLPDEFPPLTDAEKFGMNFSLKNFIIFTMEISNFT